MVPQYGRTEKAYVGGKTQAAEWIAISRDVRAYYGLRCWGCKADVRPGRGKWAVHHLDRDAHNNTPENLVLLCGRCHGQAHSFSEQAQSATTLKTLLRLLTDNQERKTRVMKRRYKRLYGKDNER